MRIIYITLFIFLSQLLFSQTIELAPVHGNAQLRSYAAKEDLKKAESARQITGVNPSSLPLNRNVEDCPPVIPPESNILASGQKLSIQLDTTDLGNGPGTPDLTILNQNDLQFGTASLEDSSIILIYTAIDGFDGVGIDSVLIEFSQPSDKDTILVVFTVVRADKVVIANPITIDPEEIVSYCLNSEINFNSPRYCAHFVDCPDKYDGEGQQSFHFTSYQFPDTCFVYYASRFPGTDTVCLEICDELGVCDLFKVPVIIRGDTLSVNINEPFFEDFSTTNGPYPAPERWLDKDVFVNTTFAKNPPSVGFVTFDGLDAKGKPYDTFGGTGDRLTSKPFDLSAFNQNSNVTLRFFYSPKGYGSEPAPEDALTLEFRNNNRQWIQVESFPGMNDVPLDSIPPFYFYSIRIDQSQFLHKAFQFRLTGNVSPGGYGDWWHVDYIHLSPGSTLDNFFGDLAFTTLPGSPLKNYSAIPPRHLKGFLDQELIDPAADSLEVTVFNHFNDVRTLPNSRVRYAESTTGTDLGVEYPIITTINIEPDTFIRLKSEFPSTEFPGFTSALTQALNGAGLNLQTSFSFVSSQGEIGIFVGNNQVVTNNPLSNYFAYDDGSAEQQMYIRFAKGGEHLVLKYHANVQDTLHAVQFMFPHYTDFEIDNQSFNLKVWVGDRPDQADPVYEGEFFKPFFPDAVYDTLQGFTTYKLEDLFGEETPVIIPPNTDFYVGFEQITQSDVGIPVGFDVNNPCDNCLWGNFGGDEWFDNLSEFFHGALMIRPVVGDVPFNTSSPVSDVPLNRFPLHIYPNPADNLLNIQCGNADEMDFYSFSIFDSTGKRLMEQKLTSTVNLHDFHPGIYWVQVADLRSGNISIQKLVIAR